MLVFFINWYAPFEFNLLELISFEVELSYDELKYWRQSKVAQVIVSKYKENLDKL